MVRVIKSKDRTYEEWGHRIIPSSFGELKGQKRYYRIFYGLVNWREADNGNDHIACVPFVQYGTTADFKTAQSRGEIRMTYPCHILTQDLDKVLAAMTELQAEFNKETDI